MLKDRILFTLKFFDLQQTPLTLGQLRNFLLNEPAVFQSGLTPAFEFAKPPPVPAAVSTDEIRQALVELSSQVQQQEGLLALAGRTELIREYGRNLKYRDHREALIRKFVPRLQLVPFVRGVGVGGSHTLGFPKPESDIDLLIILDPEFLFLGRLLVTLYFQLTGYRRHGAKIRDRFCLNHYFAGTQTVRTEKDLYNAMEYLRLRPEVFGSEIVHFVELNLSWIRQFFPNAHADPSFVQAQPRLQKLLETVCRNPLGRRLNQSLGRWQLRRIRRGEHAVADQLELSFHSKRRKFEFLKRFLC